MKLHYYPETDSLYIEFRAVPAVDSDEVAEGVVMDVDEAGGVVGFDIDRASLRLDLTTLESFELPARTSRIA
jgi:uncharacterized protein YuzE